MSLSSPHLGLQDTVECPGTCDITAGSELGPALCGGGLCSGSVTSWKEVSWVLSCMCGEELFPESVTGKKWGGWWDLG